MKKSEFIKRNLTGLCPYVVTQEIISRKWTILILQELNAETKRFTQLRRKFNITHTTLTKQLRFLEYEGLISRKIFAEVPPRVEYSLTELGESFQSVLISIELWGEIFTVYTEEKINYIDVVRQALPRKWMIQILRILSGGTKRFNELRRELDITHSILTNHLEFLMRDGLVKKKVFAEVPPHTEYSLTELGESFQTVLDSIKSWGKNFTAYLDERENFNCGK